MLHHQSPISGISCFENRWVATAGYDNRVILWDAREKQSLARAFHDHLVNQCSFSPDGRYLATASSDYTARLWSLPDLRLSAVFAGHEDDVEMIVFSPGSDQVATASRDNRVRVFGLDGGLRATMTGHESDVISVEWLADGRELISSSDDGTIRRWEATSGKLLETIDLGGIETDTLVFTPKGHIYAGNDEGEILFIDGGLSKSITAHKAGIKRLVHNAHQGLLLSASYDRTFKIWRCASDGSLELLQTEEVPACVWLRSCAFLGEDRIAFATFGTTYATFDRDRSIWDLGSVEDTPGVNAVFELPGLRYSVGDSGRVFINGNKAHELGSLCNFLGGWEGGVVTGGQLGIVFNAHTGEVVHRHHSPLNCVATFQREGKRHMVVGAYTGEGLIFREGEEGKPIYVTNVKLHDNAIKGVACSDGMIFSVCATGAAAWHSTITLELAHYVKRAHDRISNGCAVTPEGSFYSVSRDRKLRYWTGNGVRVIPTPHDHSIKCIAVSGGLVATGGYDGRIAVYDSEKEVWVINRLFTTAGISSLCADAGGHGFLASSYDGQVYEVTAPQEDRQGHSLNRVGVLQ